MTSRRNLATLFAVEGPLLRRFLHRIGYTETAEDLAQESFAKLCAADQEIAQPRAYLFRTARNLAIDETRRRRVSSIISARSPYPAETPSPEPTPEDRVIAAQEGAALTAVLAQLPERKREALLLFKVDGLSHKEIGERLGVSPRTVERYVADALAHCHVALRRGED